MTRRADSFFVRALACGALLAGRAGAWPNYVGESQIPQARCPTCHVPVNGPVNERNQFGKDWVSKDKCAWPTCVGLAEIDSDQDGFLNGEEIGFGTNPGKPGDVDECIYPTAIACGANEFCSDGPAKGDHTCPCSVGFATSGAGCVDIDECAVVPSLCAEHSTCANVGGSYFCNCDSGYLGSGRLDESGACFLVDHCADDPCSIFSHCSNSLDGFLCGWTEGDAWQTCQAGYEGDGIGEGGCRDIDECLGEPCDPLVSCENTAGGYLCGDCPAGHLGDGAVGCSPIPECLTLDCSPFAICQEADGEATCTCIDGYVGDGQVCADVDECEDDIGDCPDGLECHNVVGSYVCGCPSGQVLADAEQCTEVDSAPNPSGHGVGGTGGTVEYGGAAGDASSPGDAGAPGDGTGGKADASGGCRLARAPAPGGSLAGWLAVCLLVTAGSARRRSRP